MNLSYFFVPFFRIQNNLELRLNEEISTILDLKVLLG